MAIQRLGSSLIAKSQVGSRLRSTEEERQTGALQRGSASAQTGSPVRGSVDEPIEKLNPQGTQKIVSVQPSITPTEKSVVSKIGIAPSIGAASRVSNPSGTSNGGGTGQASNPGGGAAPASRTAFRAAQVGASASGIGRPALGYTPGGGGASGAVKGAATSKQGSVSRVTNPTISKGTSSAPKLINTFGGRVAADTPKTEPVNFGLLNSVKGRAGKVIDRIGKTLGNPLPEKNVTEKLQSLTKAQAKAPSKSGGKIVVTNKQVKQAVKKASAPLRTTAKKAGGAVKKAGATIRSLFKR